MLLEPNTTFLCVESNGIEAKYLTEMSEIQTPPTTTSNALPILAAPPLYIAAFQADLCLITDSLLSQPSCCS